MNNLVNLNTLNGRDQQAAVTISHKRSEHPWTAVALGRPLALRRDWADNKPTEGFMLSKFISTPSSLFRCDSTFDDTKKALVNYTATFDLVLKVMFLDLHKKGIVKDSLWFENLPTRGRES